MSINEFDIIRQFFSGKGYHRPDVTLGIGDDSALVQSEPGFELAIAADVLNQGIHFPESTDAHAVGHKALAVNLSDLAAMGAEPCWFTLTLSLPTVDRLWLQQFSEGLFDLAEQFQISLIGGDTVKGPLSIGIQAIGKVPAGLAMRRSGAQLGDRVFVSGTLGDAALALKQLEIGDIRSSLKLKKKLDYPSPRIALGIELRKIASSCIDISDGLIADLGHILEASEKGAVINADTIPLSNEYLKNISGKKLQLALNGGDDYELCFTAPAGDEEKIRSLASRLALSITCIGEIVDTGVLTLLDQHKKTVAVDQKGYDHFIKSSETK